MRNSAVAIDLARLWAPSNLRRAAPGVALCAAIAAVAFIADTRSLLRFGAVWVPPLILTLVIGMALQPLSARPILKPGLEFAGRRTEGYRRTLYPTFLLEYHGMWRSWVSVLPLHTGSGNKIVGFYPHGSGNLRENDLRGQGVRNGGKGTVKCARGARVLG